jgi:hypothetical protein
MDFGLKKSVLVETFGQSYKCMCCVAWMSLPLDQRTKSILVSHTKQSTEEAETRVLMLSTPALKVHLK